MLKSFPKIFVEGRLKAVIFLLVLVTFVSFYNLDLAESADTIETAGNVGEFAVPCAVVVMLFAHKDIKGAIQLAESFGTSIATTLALKYTVKETRPNGGNHSFPSAHTAVVFSNAAFIQ